jgi:capsular polysaccharide biosynthesis protein
MQFSSHDDAVVHPLVAGHGGVFAGGRVLADSLLYRGPSRLTATAVQEVVHPAEPRPPEQSLEIEAIYAGFPFDHYGHFLTEGVSRLWLARQRPDLPIIWCEPGPYNRWQREVIDILGIVNPPLFITRPTGVRRLLIPEPGCRLRAFCTAEQIAFLGRFPAPPARPDRRIWLSRTRLAEPLGRVVNEPAIEAALAADGWNILHPQQHSVHDQLRALGEAGRVAGSEGSAFHSLLLLDRVAARVDIFSRAHLSHPNYAIFGEAKGLRQKVHVMPSVIAEKGAEITWYKFRWPDEGAVLEALL